MLKIRRLRDRLIFNMGIPMLIGSLFSISPQSPHIQDLSITDVFVFIKWRITTESLNWLIHFTACAQRPIIDDPSINNYMYLWSFLHHRTKYSIFFWKLWFFAFPWNVTKLFNSSDKGRADPWVLYLTFGIRHFILPNSAQNGILWNSTSELSICMIRRNSICNNRYNIDQL